MLTELLGLASELLSTRGVPFGVAPGVATSSLFIGEPLGLVCMEVPMSDAERLGPPWKSVKLRFLPAAEPSNVRRLGPRGVSMEVFTLDPIGENSSSKFTPPSKSCGVSNFGLSRGALLATGTMTRWRYISGEPATSASSAKGQFIGG